MDGLGWPWRAIIYSVTLWACLSEPITKIWMNIDPYYQRLKCSAETLICEDIRVIPIFVGVRWKGGIKWEWCRRKLPFLLLVRYVQRSVEEYNEIRRSIYWGPTDQRPTTSHLGKFQMAISLRRRPIHFMFGSTVAFSGSADRMALIPVRPNSIGMWEKTMREEYFIDWSQSEVFLVVSCGRYIFRNFI